LRGKMVRKHVVGIKINIPRELAELIEQDAEAIGVGKTTFIRMILYQHYKPRLRPQPSRSGPVGPGGSALKGAGLAGPEAGRDEARPLVKENAGGGESG
jgi:hypothetical protein